MRVSKLGISSSRSPFLVFGGGISSWISPVRQGISSCHLPSPSINLAQFLNDATLSSVKRAEAWSEGDSGWDARKTAGMAKHSTRFKEVPKYGQGLDTSSCVSRINIWVNCSISSNCVEIFEGVPFLNYLWNGCGRFTSSQVTEIYWVVRCESYLSCVCYNPKKYQRSETNSLLFTSLVMVFKKSKRTLLFSTIYQSSFLLFGILSTTSSLRHTQKCFKTWSWTSTS